MGQLAGAREAFVVHSHRDGNAPVVELEGQASYRVVARPERLGAVAAFRIEMADEANEVVRHVARPERSEKVASMSLQDCVSLNHGTTSEQGLTSPIPVKLPRALTGESGKGAYQRQ